MKTYNFYSVQSLIVTIDSVEITVRQRVGRILIKGLDTEREKVV